MGDLLSSLPTDTSIPNEREVKIMNSIVKNRKQIGKEAYSEFKEALVTTILFVILLLPFITGPIQALIPATNNPIILIITKAIIFFIIYYIITKTYFRK